jgi:hypothetical protein
MMDDLMLRYVLVPLLIVDIGEVFVTFLRCMAVALYALAGLITCWKSDDLDEDDNLIERDMNYLNTRTKRSKNY